MYTQVQRCAANTNVYRVDAKHARGAQVTDADAREVGVVSFATKLLRVVVSLAPHTCMTKTGAGQRDSSNSTRVVALVAGPAADLSVTGTSIYEVITSYLYEMCKRMETYQCTCLLHDTWKMLPSLRYYIYVFYIY